MLGAVVVTGAGGCVTGGGATVGWVTGVGAAVTTGVPPPLEPELVGRLVTTGVAGRTAEVGSVGMVSCTISPGSEVDGTITTLGGSVATEIGRAHV